jgi:hypothetical protein
MIPRSRYPLARLNNKHDVTLYLIKEELKSRKLFHALHQAGLDDCYYQPHLDSLILRSIGIDDGRDDTFRLYYDIIDKRSKKIEADNDSIMKQALKVYMELIEVKKQLKAK